MANQHDHHKYLVKYKRNRYISPQDVDVIREGNYISIYAIQHDRTWAILQFEESLAQTATFWGVLESFADEKREEIFVFLFPGFARKGRTKLCNVKVWVYSQMLFRLYRFIHSSSIDNLESWSYCFGSNSILPHGL